MKLIKTAKKRKISILSHTLSDNALGRAYLLAKLLQDDFSVHIIGPGKVDDLWAPVREDTTVEYRTYSCNCARDLFSQEKKIINNLIDGDLIFAVKPLLFSFGLGSLAKMRLRRPLLLDIDDWEVGFLLDRWHWELQNGLKPWIVKAKSPLYTRILDKLTWFADGITVSNSFLQNKYGGCWIPHARDERLFCVKENYFSSPEPIVLFLGTPRAHKGLDVLLDAWRLTDNQNSVLRIVGINKESDVYNSLARLANNRTIFEGPVPIGKIPQILATASVIVIPQLAEKAAVGQLPAKLIDAMAAGKPIISTSVGDIPRWLSGGAGVVIPPGDVKALSQALTDLLENPIRRELLGKKAKEKFLQYASFEVIKPRMVKIAECVINKKPIRSLYSDCFT